MGSSYDADIIVVGAGTAGCYFASLAGKAGLKVLILESADPASLGYTWSPDHVPAGEPRQLPSSGT
jgi:2-polyprenyl-6-methoxyphenol hydroxylase-like FAD-dependent oxidoreductase